MKMLVRDLVSCCVSLVAEAGEIIRQVQKERENGVQLQATLKDPLDSRTYLTKADQLAQDLILSGLRTKFGSHLNIVAEEDQTPSPTQKKTKKNLQSNDTIVKVPEDLYDHVQLKDLCVFIDPVDGTREFVEGRLVSVQTLVGISLRGRAIAGVVGLPFHHDRIGEIPNPPSSATGLVLHGVVGADGIYGLEKLKLDPSFERMHGLDEKIVASSSGCTNKALRHVKDMLDDPKYLLVGGCGNKLLRILVGQADAALLNLSSSLWDTCCYDALLACVGGTMTTLQGYPIEYSSVVDTANGAGAIASSGTFDRFGQTHAQFCVKLRSSLEITTSLLKKFGLHPENPQASDIARDIDGQHFTAKYFSNLLNENVISYSVPESDAVRYKQSYCCRLKIKIEGNKKTSMFYKRVNLREMPYTIQKSKKAPFKIERDVTSCSIESKFLSSSCLKSFTNLTQTKIALPYKSEQRVCKECPLDSRFTLLLFDLSSDNGWRQYPYLGDIEIRATLKALAGFHAFFWAGRRSAACKDKFQQDKLDLKEQLWETASYWHLGQQPKDQLQKLGPSWSRMQDKFCKEFKTLGIEQNELSTIADRLSKISPDISRKVHGINEDGSINGTEKDKISPYCTIIHGDPKGANFFFNEELEKVRGLPQVGMIDFQWTGRGLASVDIAYCILASCNSDVTTPDGVGDSAYIRDYHNSLVEAFVQYNVAPSITEAHEIYPFPLFEKHYEAAFLDLARVILADHYSQITPEILKSRQDSQSFNAYNKSLSAALSFIVRLNTYLKKYEMSN